MAKRVENDCLKKVEIKGGMSGTESCFFGCSFDLPYLLTMYMYCLGENTNNWRKHVRLCFSAWWAVRHNIAQGATLDSWSGTTLCSPACCWGAGPGEDTLPQSSKLTWLLSAPCATCSLTVSQRHSGGMKGPICKVPPAHAPSLAACHLGKSKQNTCSM